MKKALSFILLILCSCNEMYEELDKNENASTLATAALASKDYSEALELTSASIPKKILLALEQGHPLPKLEPKEEELISIYLVAQIRQLKIDVVSLVKIAESNPEKNLLELLLQSLPEADKLSKAVNYLHALKEQSRKGGFTLEVMESILPMLRTAISLKHTDKDNDGKISVEEVLSMSDDEASAMIDHIRGMATQSSNLSSKDENYKKLAKKLDILLKGIDSQKGDSTGEKAKNFIKDFLNNPKESSKPKTKLNKMKKDDLKVTYEDGKRVIHSIAILGDSLAVGIGADFKRSESIRLSKDNLTPSLHEKAKALLADDGSSSDKSDANVINSIPSMLSAPAHIVEACNNGDSEDCFSIRTKLKASYLDNFAISGSRSKDVFTKQIPKLLEKKISYDMIFIHVGGNDICGDSTLEGFFSNYKKAVKQLVETLSDTYIVMIPIPDIISLFQNVDDSDLAFSLELPGGSSLDLTCGEVRWSFCPRLLKDEAPYIDSAALYSTFNSKLVEIYEEFSPSYENLILLQDVLSTKPTLESVSADCFHPGYEGTAALANSLWEELQPHIE